MAHKHKESRQGNAVVIALNDYNYGQLVALSQACGCTVQQYAEHAVLSCLDHSLHYVAKLVSRQGAAGTITEESNEDL